MGTLDVPVTNCNNLDLISLLKDRTTLQYHYRRMVNDVTDNRY